VHRPVGEQLEDRGAHVTALAAAAATGSAAPGAASSRAAGAETGTEFAAGAEATEAGSAESWAETGVTAVLADVIAEIATGLTAVFVQCATVLRAEPETEAASLEGVFWGCEWGVQGVSPNCGETPNAFPIR
jgi:hypothetical protein